MSSALLVPHVLPPSPERAPPATAGYPPLSASTSPPPTSLPGRRARLWQSGTLTRGPCQEGTSAVVSHDILKMYASAVRRLDKTQKLTFRYLAVSRNRRHTGTMYPLTSVV